MRGRTLVLGICLLLTCSRNYFLAVIGWPLGIHPGQFGAGGSRDSIGCCSEGDKADNNANMTKNFKNSAAKYKAIFAKSSFHARVHAGRELHADELRKP